MIVRLVSLLEDNALLARYTSISVYSMCISVLGQ